MQLADFWIIAPRGLAEFYFSEVFDASIIKPWFTVPRSNVENTSETSVSFHQLAWGNNPEDNHIQSSPRDNLKSV
jgi:hypothetical protein